ncbi:DUF1003 domain-containing protein [Adhaeribacter radiodurans]|uniref:DUF1003 domain-containing protein n=1 Tax=Adhaeribacter radiodurans TaxID=2745197 RepID=A0A7L7LCB6_9BACT|nr:DUF1003 domain-containing protein [Adhaeribacter radiodurans]QMU30387.1 DUF1003 domain-containing protein [Adhaeribacter radiodurans]
MQQKVCHLSKQPLNESHAYKANTIIAPLYEFIKKDYPDLTQEDYISMEQLNIYRRKYLTSLITKESGEVNDLEKEVLEKMEGNKMLSENIEPEIAENSTFGQRLADGIAEFGGSWTFIICFFSFILGWMLVNIWLFTTKPFDPYPFILLNLILSCLAAIQAPIIMMSQNRQEQKDRRRSEHDYKINLKAELEIKLLHEKLDHLMVHQNKRLLEIQELQTDFLTDIFNQMKKKNT